MADGHARLIQLHKCTLQNKRNNVILTDPGSNPSASKIHIQCDRVHLVHVDDGDVEVGLEAAVLGMLDDATNLLRDDKLVHFGQESEPETDLHTEIVMGR